MGTRFARETRKMAYAKKELSNKSSECTHEFVTYETKMEIHSSIYFATIRSQHQRLFVW